MKQLRAKLTISEIVRFGMGDDCGRCYCYCRGGDDSAGQ